MRYLLIISTLLLTGWNTNGQTIPTPDLRCVSVDANNVTLTWDVRNYDTTLVDKYHILRSNNGTDWIKTDTMVSNSATSYTYQDDFVNSTILYYYILLIQYNQYSDPSNTVSTMLLQVSSVNNGAIASLEWNHPEGGYTGPYDIYRKPHNGNWEYTGSTPRNSYLDTIAFPYCDDTTLHYQVEFTEPDLGCQYTSTVDIEILHDGTPPGNGIEIIQMDTVSVGYTGEVSLSWEPSGEPDIKEYIIYKLDNGWYNYDVVQAPQTFYIDQNSQAQNRIETYRVAAVDKCNNTGLGGYEIDPFRTMYLEPIVFDYCDTSISLSWSAYENFAEVDNYSIFQVDMNNYSLELINTTASTSYSYTAPFTPDSTYCFFIRAFETTGRSASSCVQCFFADRPDQPDTLNLQLGTVDTLNNNLIHLMFMVDTSASGNSYYILRNSENNTDWDTVASESVQNTPYIIYTDTKVDPNNNNYYYKIIIADSCGNESWLPLNQCRTILLEGSLSEQNINSLKWNEYETTSGAIAGYELFRKNRGIVDSVIYLSENETSFDDDVTHFAMEGGIFSYVVAASVLPENGSTDTLRSYSNEVGITQLSNIYLPNAFSPNGDGINDIFRPVNYFPEVTADYLMLIYNRWGQKVYESKSPYEGWNGNFNGEIAPLGVYFYYVRYLSLENINFEQKGLVTLIR